MDSSVRVFELTSMLSLDFELSQWIPFGLFEFFG